MIAWWINRTETDQAWKVKAADLKDWDLDIKNPVKKEVNQILSSKEIIKRMIADNQSIGALLDNLKLNL